MPVCIYSFHVIGAHASFAPRQWATPLPEYGHGRAPIVYN
jgi:hypothetical protein